MNKFLNNKTLGDRRGFSLMELMVSMFIFSLIMTATVGVFTRTASSFKKTKNIQKNLEDAQFAMNLMAKTIRTSSVVNFDNDTTPEIKFFDYSQNKCIQYKIDTGAMQMSTADYFGTEVKKVWCKDASLGTPNNITSGYIDGTFDVTPSTEPAPPAFGSVGRVTISMKVCEASDCAESDKVKIQSTVSLRDYNISGIQ